MKLQHIVSHTNLWLFLFCVQGYPEVKDMLFSNIPYAKIVDHQSESDGIAFMCQYSWGGFLFGAIYTVLNVG